MGVGDVALTAAGWLAALACSLPVCSAARVVRVCTSAVITCYHAAGPCRLIWSVDCSDREEQDHWSLQFCTRSQGGQYICTVPEKVIVVGPTWRCAAAGLWPTYPPMGAGWAPPRRVRNSWTTTSKRPQIDANAKVLLFRLVVTQYTHNLTCQLSMENRASTLALSLVLQVNKLKGVCGFDATNVESLSALMQ